MDVENLLLPLPVHALFSSFSFFFLILLLLVKKVTVSIKREVKDIGR